MRKELHCLFMLFCFIFSNVQLQAKDFTIKGKVSLIQESVPLPFYDVNITDQTGKYVTTVKTSFSGKYSYTFDIPDSDIVDFEVSVIDQCTGQSIIKAFEKEGSKVSVNFIVCNSDGSSDEDDEDNNDNNNDNNNNNDDDEDDDDDDDNDDGTPIWGEWGDLLDCAAFGLDIKVCAKSEDGTIAQFNNACEAVEAGYKLHHLQLCDGLPIEGNGDGLDGVNCDIFGIEIPVEVCIINDNGEISTLLLCDALAEGYALDELEFCNGSGIDSLTSIDCDELGINIPVCVVDEEGNKTKFNSPCEAFDAGYDLHSLTYCDDILGGGLGNIDCDALGIDLSISVCVANDAGETEELQLCDALSKGFSFEGLKLCDGALDNLDCEGIGIAIPVCSTDGDGNELNFDNPCDALAAGIDIHQLNFCGGIDGLPGLGIEDLDCESLDIDIPFTVCVIDPSGTTQELELCEALTSGMSLESLSFCDGGMSILDSLDCDELGINIPVCIKDTNSEELSFDNPCLALDAGYDLHELTFCGDIFGGNGIGGLDCESLGLDVDIPVCLTNGSGEQVELMLCEALSNGLALEDVTLCEGALDDIDCAGLSIDLPVCLIDSEGNELNFDNPCEALSAGISFSDLTFCEGLIDGIINDLDCDNWGLDLPVAVCVTNDAGDQVEFNLCDALTQGISPENIELCGNTFDGISDKDCEGLGLDIPVCVEDADGNKIEFKNPCEAFEAGWKIGDLGFCENLLQDAMAGLGLTDTEETPVVITKAELFPNPVNSILNLNLGFTKNAEFEVSIKAINGNAIYRQKFYASNGENMTQVDVSSLTVGIYVIQVVSGQGNRTLKFVKQ